MSAAYLIGTWHFPKRKEISSSPSRVNTQSKHSRDWQLIELKCVQMPDTF